MGIALLVGSFGVSSAFADNNTSNKGYSSNWSEIQNKVKTMNLAHQQEIAVEKAQQELIDKQRASYKEHYVYVDPNSIGQWKSTWMSMAKQTKQLDEDRMHALTEMKQRQSDLLLKSYMAYKNAK